MERERERKKKVWRGNHENRHRYANRHIAMGRLRLIVSTKPHRRCFSNKCHLHKVWPELVNHCAECHAVAPRSRQIGYLNTLIIFGHLFAPLEQILTRSHIAHPLTRWIWLFQVERSQRNSWRNMFKVSTVEQTFFHQTFIFSNVIYSCWAVR